MLAWRSTVTTTFSGGSPSLRAVASRMRALAWCGTTQSTSAGAKPGRVEHFAQHVGEVDDRVAEHLAALHAQLADRAGGRGPAVDVEHSLWRPSAWSRVASMPGVSPSSADEHQRAGAVAEQDAGGAVLPVEDAAEGLGADHQRALAPCRVRSIESATASA